MSITLNFFGAAQGVTGSRHLLDVDGTRILVDCGLFQGRRKESFLRNRDFRLPGEDIHNVVLTHAHIDHSGALPLLVKSGFKGEVFATPATCDLVKILLRDSGHIHEKDAEYMNKRLHKEARRNGKNPDPTKLVEPLYTTEDAEKVDSRLHGVPYHHEVTIGPDITLDFSDQGHIIGSAAALVTVKRPDRTLRILFSGDRGRDDMPILRNPEPYPECDVLLTECTYGDRVHDPVHDMETELREHVRWVIARRGKLVIPAFSVGRTQNILYHLHRLILDGELPRIPIFVDSPLSTKATSVYGGHPECFDAETLEFLREKVNPFHFEGLEYVESVDDSRALNDREGPFVVLSASGMCESGRILHHLKNSVTDKNNLVLLVGFMGRHTLGRRLLEGADAIKIFDRTYPVRCKVAKMNGLSAHGDREDIARSVRHLTGKVQTIFLVHGEEDQAAAMKELLEAEGHQDVRIAELFTSVEI